MQPVLDGSAAGRTKITAPSPHGEDMNAPAETDRTLQELSDPELIAIWAEARQRLALGQGSKSAYELARAEYERRVAS
jgi:hypothetical protein